MSAFTVRLYRYNPEQDDAPYNQDIEVDGEFRNRMVLDVLEHLKTRDPTLSFRRSCREGVCGSDGLSMNGRNGLGCITRVADIMGKKDTLEIRPLPGMPVIRDLVVDQSLFFKQYEQVQPWLINDDPEPAIERLQSPEDRAKLDGLYECILCACCTSACPSWWWNPEKYIGPSGLLQAYRFLVDSRDTATRERLAKLEDPFSVFRCRGIGNCTAYCPKGLNPMKAIGHIKIMLVREQV
ncbi:succinate dehydrogenase / fumarate reductase iron-sulfur subunit [Marinobacter pelagius]|uniref:Succinate dehydrogenase iron-sulfur subunit n=1 Tax=Marinobacter pelagius TaxID=379482 RepID=A0A1I4VDF1_9GAMM|nr:succinate dehydrogenase iron-sulfur subunit [Marinobacter pelagius]SFM99212.1 succinate dehydrogenase / fumarate reductase iron-sulfur subunit [Marinobacter pelagius]